MLAALSTFSWHQSALQVSEASPSTSSTSPVEIGFINLLCGYTGTDKFLVSLAFKRFTKARIALRKAYWKTPLNELTICLVSENPFSHSLFGVETREVIRCSLRAQKFGSESGFMSIMRTKSSSASPAFSFSRGKGSFKAKAWTRGGQQLRGSYRGSSFRGRGDSSRYKDDPSKIKGGRKFRGSRGNSRGFRGGH